MGFSIIWQRADHAISLIIVWVEDNHCPLEVCLLYDNPCFVVLLPQMEQLSPEHLAQPHCLGSCLASRKILQVP